MEATPVNEPMSEEQARELCAHLAATHADRATHQWLPRRNGDGWQVMKVAIPPPDDGLKAELHAAERPDQAEDPRSNLDRNVGPWGGGGAF